MIRKMMPALELLCKAMGVNAKKFSKEESFLLEADLYARVSNEIWNIFKSQYRDYFHLIRLNIERESSVMELQIVRCLINDILKSEDYSLSGIAYYTNMPEEVIQDLMIGYKVSPMIGFTRKLIELHKLIRPDIYQNIIKKITEEEE